MTIITVSHPREKYCLQLFINIPGSRTGSLNQISLLSFLFSAFSGQHLQHMEVPRLGVQWELQLPAYDTATATPDQSRIFDLHDCSWQRQLLIPLSKARD